MLRIALKMAAARKRRLLLTATAVVLGVTFVSGTVVLTDTSNKLFADQFSRASTGIDVVVRDASASSLAMGAAVERKPIATEVLERVRRAPGVARAEGVVLGSAPLVVDRIPVRADDAVGMSWSDSTLNPYRLRSGRAPRARGEMVIDAATAKATGVRIGSAVTVSLPSGSHAHTIVGTAGLGDSAGMAGTSVALFAPDVARALFGLASGWSELHVAAGGTTAYDLQRVLGSTLGKGFSVASARDIAAARAQDAKSDMRFLTGILAALALTSLVVGSFMIANTFSIVVAQRTRELATLRAVGASVRQVRGTVLVEAAVLGALASAAGALLGIGVASALRSFAASFGAAVPDGSLVVSPRTLAGAFLIGTVVTIVAALLPARRAARVAPAAAMRDVDATPVPVPRRRVAAGAAVAGSGAVLLVVGAASRTLPVVGAAAFTTLVGTVLIAPAYAGRVAAALGRMVDRGGVAARLARVNVRRAGRRTSATAATLIVALAVVTFMTVLATSAKRGIDEGIDEVLRADLIVEAGQMRGLSPDVYELVQRVDGVSVVSRTRHGHGNAADGTARPMTAVDHTTFAAVARVDLLDGRWSGLSRGGVVLTDDAAVAEGVGVGDELRVTFPRTGAGSLRVAGIMDSRDGWLLGAPYVVSLETLARYVAPGADATVYVTLDDGADAAVVRDAIQAAVARFPTVAIKDAAELKGAEAETFDAILGLVGVLLVLTVGIALFGITNTLALSIVERTREIGMLRAVGMSRRQLARMIRMEAALTAAVGGVVGTALGIAVSFAAVHALSSMKVIEFALPIVHLAGYVLVAGLGGVAAGVSPARRAARLDVLHAMS